MLDVGVFLPYGSSLSRLIPYQYYLFFSVPERNVIGSRSSNDILPYAPPYLMKTEKRVIICGQQKATRKGNKHKVKSYVRLRI